MIRELFEAINAYPWTAFFVGCWIICVAGALPNVRVKQYHRRDKKGQDA